MALHFDKHYTREEARSLLPRVREWLELLRGRTRMLSHLEETLGPRLVQGEDLGGAASQRWVRTVVELQETLREFRQRRIQIKDLDRGLIDFPAIVAGREVFLCWEQDEEDIEFWHDLDAGFAGRTRL